jgi:Tfp pilus assembly protein PilX
MMLNGRKSMLPEPGRQRSRGIALVSVLWVLVLLSLMLVVVKQLLPSLVVAVVVLQ